MIQKIKHHRYKLNENSKSDRASVNGVILTKTWTAGSMNPKQELSPFVMTRENPQGTIDYEIFLPHTKEILYNNREAMERKVPIYQIAELLVKKREDLVYIAEYYGISVVNKSNQFLISLISQKQEARAKEEGIEAPTPITPAQAMNEGNKKAVVSRKPASKKEPPKMW